MRPFRTAALVGLLVAAGTAAAHADVYDDQVKSAIRTDAPGAADNPLTGRYAGSAILAQTRKEFDELVLPAGPIGAASDPRNGATARAEGRVTRTIYVVPTERSTLEVTRNYQTALAAKGFEPVFECAAAACGSDFAGSRYSWSKPDTQVVGATYDRGRTAVAKAVFDYVKDVRYLLMKKAAPEGDTLVALYSVVMTGGSNGNLSDTLKGTTQTLLEIVEPKLMQQNLVTIAAADIASKVMAEGRIAFYGINFDFDKADIRPDSEPQLAEMAKFLAASPQLRAFIVGHTDNKGGLDYNLSLSQRRAEAVAKALATRYRVDPKRLGARGLGALAPVASNHTEDGQARNRRVELVEQ